jgi:hypothetical protein
MPSGLIQAIIRVAFIPDALEAGKYLPGDLGPEMRRIFLRTYGGNPAAKQRCRRRGRTR